MKEQETETGLICNSTGKQHRPAAGALSTSLPALKECFLKVTAARSPATLQKQQTTATPAPVRLWKHYQTGRVQHRRTFWKSLVGFLKDDTMSLKTEEFCHIPAF